MESEEKRILGVFSEPEVETDLDFDILCFCCFDQLLCLSSFTLFSTPPLLPLPPPTAPPPPLRLQLLAVSLVL